MRCIYCDSHFKKLPKNAVCPNCGAIVLTLEERKAMIHFPAPPMGVCKGNNGELKISQDCVIFRIKYLGEKYDVALSYCDLVSVSFQQATNQANGFLCARDYSMRHYPFPKDILEATMDTTCITFDEHANADFACVAAFLEECVKLADDVNGEDHGTENEKMLGRFYGMDGYVELGQEAVTIYKYLQGQATSVQVIPYGKIAEVTYKKGGIILWGGISIRVHGEQKNMTDAIRFSSQETRTIGIRQFHNDIFYRVYRKIQKAIKSTV